MRVGTDGGRESRVTQVNGADSVDGPGQGHIVNQRTPDRFDAADFLERSPANQHRTAGPGSYTRAWIVDAGERIEHLEEVHERRHEGALREARAIQPDHLAHQLDARPL